MLVDLNVVLKCLLITLKATVQYYRLGSHKIPDANCQDPIGLTISACAHVRIESGLCKASANAFG